MAHELNQPLGAILANAEAAQIHTRRSPPDLDEIRKIRPASARMTCGPGRSSSGCGISFGGVGSIRGRSTRASLVEETLKLIGADASARKTEVIVQSEPDVPGVQGDRVHLAGPAEPDPQQPGGTGRVSDRSRRLTHSARTHRERRRGHRGRGHRAGDCSGKAPRIFEPFQTTKPAGLGLGLPICRSIMEAHGGRIRIDSLPGRGTRVRLTLPAAPTSVGAESSVVPRSPSVGRPTCMTPSSPSPGCTVFVVDDDPSFRRAIARLLQASGYAVQTFASAREFLQRLARRPGCVLVDLRMPGSSGLDLQPPRGAPTRCRSSS